MNANQKVLKALSDYVDSRYLSSYQVQGYYGFLYLKYGNGDDCVVIEFDYYNDEVHINEVSIDKWK